jgi:hypothetical protein
MWLASTRIDTAMLIATVPSRRSVVAALRPLGLRNAGTPLLIASTPVRAAEPEANARMTRNTIARPPIPPEYSDIGVIE